MKGIRGLQLNEILCGSKVFKSIHGLKKIGIPRWLLEYPPKFCEYVFEILVSTKICEHVF